MIEVAGLHQSGGRPPGGVRRNRWFSGRALLLHLTLVVVVGGCLTAGWWQATRALSGNGLSWFYSVEWPAFAVVAAVAWWHLIHEDPEAYEARRRQPEHQAAASSPLRGEWSEPLPTVRMPTFRLASLLAAGVVIDSALGVASVVSVPLGRPSGLIPAHAPVTYLLHFAIGAFLAVGAGALLIQARGSTRLSRLTGWIGAIGLALSGVGGLLTAPHALRFAGMALMLLGAVTAGFGYSIPVLERLSGSDAVSPGAP